MNKNVFRVGVVVLLVCMFAACNSETATQRRADENARLNRYIADSGYVVVTTPPDSASTWVDSATGKDIYLRTKTGLLYHQIRLGTGKAPISGPGVTGSYASVHYQLYTLDSSEVLQDNMLYPPLGFNVGGTGVIPGMSEATYMMREGGISKAIMPSIIAYDSRGSSDGTIAPYQTIIYTIYLVDVK